MTGIEPAGYWDPNYTDAENGDLEECLCEEHENGICIDCGSEKPMEWENEHDANDMGR